MRMRFWVKKVMVWVRNPPEQWIYVKNDSNKLEKEPRGWMEMEKYDQYTVKLTYKKLN